MIYAKVPNNSHTQATMHMIDAVMWEQRLPQTSFHAAEGVLTVVGYMISLSTTDIFLYSHPNQRTEKESQK